MPARAFSLLRVTIATFVGALVIALVLAVLALQAPEPYIERVDLPALSGPPEVPESGGYAFERRRADGTGVTYDPCRPIPFVVSRTSEPPGGAEVLASALEEVSQATGLALVYEGDTNEIPRPERPVYQPLLYGQRFSPVLVAWSNPEATPDLAGRVLGRGGSSALTSDGESVLVTGALELDGPEIGGLIAGGDAASARATIVHELGHLVGLAHVGTPGELMNPVLDPSRVDLGPGDRYGLMLAGSGPCFSGLDDPELLESLADVKLESSPEHLLGRREGPLP